MTERSKQKFQSDWWSKSFAAIFLGALLSYGLIAFFVWFGPDNLTQSVSNERALWRTQFTMWSLVPIWLLIISFTYMFRSGTRAWLGLGIANVIVYSLLLLLRGMI